MDRIEVTTKSWDWVCPRCGYYNVESRESREEVICDECSKKFEVSFKARVPYLRLRNE